ncbi:MAG: Ig-like domain-containing protein [Actinomycetota bacterium]
MRLTRGRRITVAAAAVLILAVAIPALSATGAGTVSFATPRVRGAVRGSTPVSWAYQAGDIVKSTSHVTISATTGSSWKVVAQNLWIQGGGFWWDTTKWTDGVYALRVGVDGTSVQGFVYPVYVDNTNPVVRLTSPAHDLSTGTEAPLAIVQGNQTLDVRATDATSGVRLVRWILDGKEIARGYPVKYNFNWKPGQHILTAFATDMAGNTSSDSMTIIAIPDSTITTDPPPNPGDIVPDVNDTPSPSVPGGIEPPVLPTPDVGVPTLPPVDVPSPDPSVVPGVPSPDASPPPVDVPSIPPTPLPG